MAQAQIRRIGYALGAAVTGIDLRSALDEETVATLRRSWPDHLVLCFPNQELTKDQFVAFAGRFGEYDRDSYLRPADAENPSMRLLTNTTVDGRPWDGFKEGRSWEAGSYQNAIDIKRTSAGLSQRDAKVGAVVLAVPEIGIADVKYFAPPLARRAQRNVAAVLVDGRGGTPGVGIILKMK